MARAALTDATVGNFFVVAVVKSNVPGTRLVSLHKIEAKVRGPR